MCAIAATVALDNPVGARAAASTISVTEKQSGGSHQTLLRCVAFDLGAFGDEAGQGQYAGAKVYSFPEGMVEFESAVIQGSVTLAAPAIDAWAGSIGLGTTVPLDHQDAANLTGAVMPKVAISASTAIHEGRHHRRGSAATGRRNELRGRWNIRGPARDALLRDDERYRSLAQDEQQHRREASDTRRRDFRHDSPGTPSIVVSGTASASFTKSVNPAAPAERNPIVRPSPAASHPPVPDEVAAADEVAANARAAADADPGDVTLGNRAANARDEANRLRAKHGHGDLPLRNQGDI